MAKKQSAVEKRWELNLKVATIYGWKNITHKQGAIYYGANPKYSYSSGDSVISKIPNYVNNLGNLVDVLQSLHYHWQGEKWATMIKYFEETISPYELGQPNQDLLFRFVGRSGHRMCEAIVKTHEEWESGEGLGVS